MNHTPNSLLADLSALIADLGKDGGLLSPSIYDTAQVLRAAPPAQGPGPGLRWLLAQQQPDGGWGDPSVPRARAVPTLAAMLAVQTYSVRARERMAVQQGMEFLRRQAAQWADLPEDLPVGVELLLPSLIDQAARMGLEVAREPYAALTALGARRRALIARGVPRAGTPALHSWEAWGADPCPDLIDGSGGIGHSPAATAAWLRAASARADRASACAEARRYLERAAAATGTGIPGVVPTVWPIARFEQSFALYALLTADLLDHPDLHDAIQPQISDLARALRPGGIGMSDFFTPDGDDTAAALAVLHAAGRPVGRDALHAFARGDHFCAYPGELQPSVSVTTHAMHLLALLGEEYHAGSRFVTARQLHDGRWRGDKWNSSWLYTTSQALRALHGRPFARARERAVDALLRYQHADGGWGTHGSTAEETAYAILGLRAIRHERRLARRAGRARARGEQWMLRNYRPGSPSQTTCWLGKEMYRPYRLARLIELVATVPVFKIATANDV